MSHRASLAAGPLSPEEQAEWEDARYGAALIKEAMQRLDHTDQLSNYERRVALREIKDFIRGTLEELRVEPSNADAKRFLAMNENSETQQQLVVLRKQMDDLMQYSGALARGIVGTCRQLAALWDKHDYAPGDLFEVRIRSAPERVPATPLIAAVLQAMIDVWTRFDAESDEARLAAAVAQEERYRVLLLGCGVPEHLASVVISEVPSGGPSLELRVERLSSALEELADLQRRINTLGRMPQPRTALEYEQLEEWIVNAEKLLATCRAWELASGVPIYAPLGASLFTLLDPAEFSDAPYVDMLAAALRKVKTVDTGV